jgi:hypothetical protein
MYQTTVINMYILIELTLASYASIMVVEAFLLSWYFRHHKAAVAIMVSQPPSR